VPGCPLSREQQLGSGAAVQVVAGWHRDHPRPSSAAGRTSPAAFELGQKSFAALLFWKPAKKTAPNNLFGH